MTTRDERRMALKNVNQLFNGIFNAKEWPRVPKAIRQRIVRYGRHYPYNYLIDQMCDAYEALENEYAKRTSLRPRSFWQRLKWRLFGIANYGGFTIQVTPPWLLWLTRRHK